MPILANILITAKQGKIEVMATDLEVSIKDSCEAVVSAEGSITINARKLFSASKCRKIIIERFISLFSLVVGIDKAN